MSSDEVYEQNEQRFLGLLQKLLDIRKSIEHYRTTALPIFCSSCASLGADVWSVVSVDAVGKGTDAEKFRHAMCAVNESKDAKSHYVNTAVSGLSRSLVIQQSGSMKRAVRCVFRTRFCPAQCGSWTSTSTP